MLHCRFQRLRSQICPLHSCVVYLPIFSSPYYWKICVLHTPDLIQMSSLIITWDRSMICLPSGIRLLELGSRQDGLGLSEAADLVLPGGLAFLEGLEDEVALSMEIGNGLLHIRELLFFHGES